MDITIQLSYERGYCVLFLGKTIYSIIACLQTPLPDFSEWWEWLTRATFEIPFSTKLFSGSRRNFEDGCQDSRQLLLTSHPGERQFFLSPHAENVVYLALEVLQYISYRISLLTPVTSFLFVCFFLLLLKNFCAQAPCKNYGTCQSGFTRKRYRCLCASGFTGHDCEEGDA